MVESVWPIGISWINHDMRTVIDEMAISILKLGPFHDTIMDSLSRNSQIFLEKQDIKSWKIGCLKEEEIFYLFFLYNSINY